jgi:hypothetical protein
LVFHSSDSCNTLASPLPAYFSSLGEMMRTIQQYDQRQGG